MTDVTQPQSPLPRPKYWNVWWLLTILAASIGIIALILEGLGVFAELSTLRTDIVAGLRRVEDLLRQRLS